MRIDPRMLRMLRQAKVELKELDGVEEVRIRMRDKDLVFESPSVTVVEAAGIKTYQIVGTPTEIQRIREEDVKLVMEQTGASEEEAREALRKSEGDIAAAILSLKK